MYQSIYDISPFSDINTSDSQTSFDHLVAIRDYFYSSFPKNQANSYHYLKDFKMPYLPFKYYSRFKNFTSCGYRDGYMCFFYSTSSSNGIITWTKAYSIYIYDYYHDQYIYLGTFNRVNPTDNTELSLMSHGKCNSNSIFVKCGTSYLDDFMYSGKSSDIFITCLYFFIPILLFIIGLKVLKKGLFK